MATEIEPVGVTVFDGDFRFEIEVTAGKWQTFRVSEEALSDLEGATGEFDRLKAFENHKPRIILLAMKMIASGIAAPEIILPTKYFG